MKISIIIPVYKNKELLKKSFENNHRYIKECEIIVVNDYPDESITDIFEEYPSVKVITNERNLGFAMTVNRGVKGATGELLFLLNSDVFLKDDSYKKAITQFEENEKLFAISFAQIEHNKSIVGKNRSFFRNGLIMHTKANNLEKGPTGWAEGGTCIIRKTYFDKLGGFDTIYSPFYWEDVDLSLRAQRKGWEVIFDPQIKVEHHHESTIGKYFKSDFKEMISYRNQFICTWKNASASELVLHLVHIPRIVAQAVISKNWNLLHGFLRAVRSLGN